MSRGRYPLLFAAVASLVAIVTVGCSSGGSQSQSATAQTTITVGVGQTGNAISTLDPSQWGAQILIDQGTVMEGLYGYSPTGQIVPKIATHYTTSDGGRVWTFYLRQNAKWSNGQPVTAEDFYYAWMRTASPQNTNDAIWASVMNYVDNGYAYHAGSVPASQVGVKVVGPYELQVTLDAPHNILGAMVIAGSMPLYPPSVKAHPSNWFMPQYFVSDAPYTVSSFVPNGQVTLVRNPDYVGASGVTNVGNIKQINVIPSPSVPVEDFLSGKLSAAVITQPSDYEYVLSHASLKSDLHTTADNQIVYFQWDKSTTASPLDNQTVRQAIAEALDRQPIVQSVLNGMGGATDEFGFPGWPTYSLQKPLSYNVTQAKQLLAQAGYPGGKGIPTIDIYAQVASTAPTSIPVAEAVQEELKQSLGINSTIVPETATIYGYITWDGLTSGIKPGYVIGGGTPNWSDYSSLPIEGNQETLFPGAIGTASFRQTASNYYFPTYDPTDVAELGNPADTSMGTTQAEWNKINQVAESDIAYLNSWNNKQPAAYQAVLLPPGQATNQQEWNNYTTAWKNAKTASAKHAAWLAAWEFVGDWSAGASGANIGLNGKVWDDQHQPQSVYDTAMWNSELNGALSQSSADQLAADLDNTMLQDGYGEPLYYDKTFYLEQPGLTGIEANPWSWGGLFQLQYATWK